jgi:hypothetical protein
MEPQASAIPPFRPDGYLLEGLHRASEAEVFFRFGTATCRRRQLALRLRHGIALARQVGGRRVLIDGSFVTAKGDPNEVDAVLLLPPHFAAQAQADRAAAPGRYTVVDTEATNLLVNHDTGASGHLGAASNHVTGRFGWSGFCRR